MSTSRTNSALIGADISIDELKERATYMRGLNLVSLCCAGSGHSGTRILGGTATQEAARSGHAGVLYD